MQKNTKDLDTKKVKKIVKEEVKTKKEITSKVSAKTASSKSSSKKSTSKKASTSRATSAKSADKAVAKEPAKKSSTSASNKKTSTNTKKSTNQKKKNTTKKVSKTQEIIEYYDLPYRYNQTIVKLLAQTPNTLFVYWDISDEDRKKYIEQFGENFFQNTTPVLIIHNTTLNYTFEIEINDFANCWYFNVKDANCEYKIELGRRAKNNEVQLINNYLPISFSNNIDVPNDHILFEKEQKVLFFRNVKSNTTFTKNASQFEFMSYVGKASTIYDIYKKIYTEEQLTTIENPSSNFSEGAF